MKEKIFAFSGDVTVDDLLGKDASEESKRLCEMKLNAAPIACVISVGSVKIFIYNMGSGCSFTDTVVV